ncbi:hypothetical protein KKI24_24930 [bacterium]|nr:hypothetical protein [bacterium]
MNRKTRFLLYIAGILLTAGLMLSSCAKSKPAAAGKSSPCIAEDKIMQEIASEAQLEEFSCFFKQWEGSNTLHFKVGLKNKSSSPQRFKVHIFLDNGKAVGGLIPRTTKGGLIKPGDTADFVYPVSGMPDKPGEITLVVKPISE